MAYIGPLNAIYLMLEQAYPTTAPRGDFKGDLSHITTFCFTTFSDGKLSTSEMGANSMFMVKTSQLSRDKNITFSL